jgi:hypothetical protein
MLCQLEEATLTHTLKSLRWVDTRMKVPAHASLWSKLTHNSLFRSFRGEILNAIDEASYEQFGQTCEWIRLHKPISWQRLVMFLFAQFVQPFQNPRCPTHRRQLA